MSKQSKATAQAAVEPEMTDFEKAILAQIQDWETVETGFPPYWKPTVGQCIIARVATVDARDETFIRYVLQATKVAIPCTRGPTDDAEEVIVPPGDFFTMSEYASLDLERFFDMEVFIKVTGTRSLPGNEESKFVKRTMFEFEVRVSPSDHERLKAMRAEDMKFLVERRKLNAGDKLAALPAN